MNNIVYTIRLKIRDEKFRELSEVILVSFILLTILFLRTDKLLFSNPNFYLPWDHHKYIEMARDPFTFHIAPYCWRILVPTIAYLIPTGVQNSFLLITSISIFLTSIIIYYILKEYKFTKYYAFLGLFLYYGLGWATKYFLYDFWLVDPITILFITLIIYSCIRNNYVAFIILLSIGVLAKETVFFAAPLFYSLNVKKLFEPKLFIRFFVAVVPAILVFTLIRILIPNYNNNIEYLASLPNSLKIVYNGTSDYNFNIYFHPLPFIIKNLIGAFGLIILILPFFNLKVNLRLFYRYSPFILLVFLQFFSPINLPRLFIVGFPIFIILALNGAKKLIEYKVPFIQLFILVLLLYLGNLMNPELPNLSVRYQAVLIALFIIISVSIRSIRKYENRLFR